MLKGARILVDRVVPRDRDTRYRPRGQDGTVHPADGSSGDLLADRRFEWARELAANGDFAAAADLFAQALERVPGWAPGWHALGAARAKLDDRAGAVQAYREALRLDPSDRLGSCLAMAALGAAPAPDIAPPAYIVGLFDDYAPRFDAHLRDALAYRGPALLRAALDRVTPPPARFGRVLDLGCGTGLMGEAIRDRVDWLSGIDLSPSMVEQARAKGVYDRLGVGELLGSLKAEKGLDLILAADVLVYSGDLRPVLHAASSALADHGLFAFTLQRGADHECVRVGPDLRFFHSPAFLRSLAGPNGFAIVFLSEESTRREAGADVPGLVAVLRKQPAP